MSAVATTLMGSGRTGLVTCFRNLAIGKPFASPQLLPKRPPGPWLTFMQGKLPEYRKNNPDLKHLDLVKKLSEDYNKLSPSKKTALDVGYARERAKWQKSMDAVPAQDKEAYLNQQRNKRAVKKKRAMEKEMALMRVILGKPKRPQGSFLLYCDERRKDKKIQELPVSDQTKTLASEWRDLTKRKKAAYHMKYLQQRASYETEMASWNSKMVKEGKIKEILEKEAELVALKKKIAQTEAELKNLKK